MQYKISVKHKSSGQILQVMDINSTVRLFDTLEQARDMAMDMFDKSGEQYIIYQISDKTVGEITNNIKNLK